MSSKNEGFEGGFMPEVNNFTAFAQKYQTMQQRSESLQIKGGPENRFSTFTKQNEQVGTSAMILLKELEREEEVEKSEMEP